MAREGIYAPPEANRVNGICCIIMIIDLHVYVDVDVGAPVDVEGENDG